MAQTEPTMREKLFTMRMSAEESERLDTVAAHYGLNGAGVIRMLLKREADVIRADARKCDDEEKGWRDEHSLVMGVVNDNFEADGEGTKVEDIDGHAIDIGLKEHTFAKFRRGVGAVFNDLRRWGYVTRRAGAYVPTAKALALRAPAEDRAEKKS